MATEHQKKVDELSQQKSIIDKSILAHGAAKVSYEQMARIARAVEQGQKIDSLVKQTRIDSPILNKQE